MDFLPILLQNLEEDSSDPFNHYAVALEYLKTDQNKSKDYFDTLLSQFPEYLPTYYHAALLFENINEIEKAKSTLEKGIILAENQKKDKAKKELQIALQNLIFEYDLD